MAMPVQVTFRKMARVRWLEADVRARAAQLERYYPDIVACRVVVEPAGRGHDAGNRYHVGIHLNVPGEEIVASHDASVHAAAKASGTRSLTKQGEVRRERRRANVAVRHTFEAARRQLQDFRRRQRGA